MSKDGSILTIGANEINIDVRDFLRGIADGSIVKANQKNNIVLAFNN